MKNEKREEGLPELNFDNSKILQLNGGEIPQLDFFECTSYKFESIVLKIL